MHTTHGHHILGTPIDNQPLFVTRCGGPGVCVQCSMEAGLTQLNNTKKETIEMEFNDFVRKPFAVEAVEVTTENIEEVAKHVGTLQKKTDGTPFIQVDRRLIPNVYRVYPGFWMTRMGDNIRCYSRRVFTEQFVRANPEIQNAVDIINGPAETDATEATQAEAGAA